MEYARWLFEEEKENKKRISRYIRYGDRFGSDNTFYREQKAVAL